MKKILSLILTLAMLFGLSAEAAAFFETPDAEYIAENPVYEIPAFEEPALEQLPYESVAPEIFDPYGLPAETATPVLPEGELEAPKAGPKCPDGRHTPQSYGYVINRDGHWLRCAKCGYYYKEPHVTDGGSYCSVCYFNTDDYSGRITDSLTAALPYALQGYMTEGYFLEFYYNDQAKEAIATLNGYDFYTNMTVKVTTSYTVYGYGEARLGFSHQYADGRTIDVSSGYPEYASVDVSVTARDLRTNNCPENVAFDTINKLIKGIRFRIVGEDGTVVAGSESGEFDVTSLASKLKCATAHDYVDGTCTICGDVIPTSIGSVDLSQLMDMTVEDAKAFVETAFGNAATNNSYAATDMYESYTVQNPLNPNDSFSLGLPYDYLPTQNGVKGRSRVYQVSLSNMLNETGYFSNVRFDSRIPYFCPTVAQLDALAASDPNNFYRSQTDLTLQDGRYPDGAVSVSYSMRSLSGSKTTTSLGGSFTNTRGYPSDKDEQGNPKYPTLMTDAEFLSQTLSNAYIFDISYNPDDYPDNSFKSVNLIGSAIEDFQKTAAPTFEDLNFYGGNWWQYSSSGVSSGVNKYGSQLLGFYTDPIGDKTVIRGFITEFNTYGNLGYILEDLKAVVCKAIPNTIDGFKLSATTAELEADPTVYTTKTAIPSGYIIGGQMGYYKYFTIIKDGKFARYYWTNLKFGTNNLNLTVDDTQPAYLLAAYELPEDFSSSDIVSLLNISADEVKVRVPQDFASKYSTTAINSYGQNERYPNSVSANDTLTYRIGAYYKDKVEKVDFQSYLRDNTIDPPQIFGTLPKIGGKTYADFDTSNEIRALAQSHPYTLTETPYWEYYNQDKMIYRKAENIDQYKVQVYKIDMGDYFIQAVFPNYSAEYDYDANGMPVGRRIDTSKLGNFAVSELTVITKNPEALIPLPVGEDGCIYVDPASGEIVRIDTNLTEITIPAFADDVAVTGIAAGAFEGSSVEVINVPLSVKNIDEAAFEGCANLTTINYDGSEASWAAIFKGSLPENVTLNCLNKLVGDLDGDGKVAVSDGVVMQRILAGLETDPAKIALADLDHADGVNVKDGVKMQRILAGLEG